MSSLPETLPMLNTIILVIIAADPVPIILDKISLGEARSLDGKDVQVTFLIGKLPYYWNGTTIVGANDSPDGVERTAFFRYGHNLSEGKQVTLKGKIRLIDHPARLIGKEVVPPWTEIRVEG
jgi:hypothetical protein